MNKSILKIAISVILTTNAKSLLADPDVTLTNNFNDPSAIAVDNHDSNLMHVHVDKGVVASGNAENRFFSFNKFNVRTNETVRFDCTGNCGNKNINNVIARINPLGTTGQSNLLGTIEFEANNSRLANTNLWLFNPQGFVIGSNAVIDVPGAFHISNAAGVNIGGGAFDSFSTASDVSSLNVEPSAFTTVSASDPNSNKTVSPSGAIVVRNGADLRAGGQIEIDSQGAFNTDMSGATLAADGGIKIKTEGALNLANVNTLTANGTGTVSIVGSNLVVASASTTTIDSGGGLTINNGSNQVTTGAGTASYLGGTGIANIAKLTSDTNITNVSGTFDGSLESTGGTLTNNGTITNAATVTGNYLLTNEAGGVISGGATSSGGLTNRGSISNGATTLGNHLLTNEAGGLISGSATSGGGLTNGGSISGNASAAGVLTNSGSINGSASANGALNNSGSIQLDATVSGNQVLTNQASGLISGNATSGGGLSNAGDINGAASASGTLTNTGTIQRAATVNGNYQLTNTATGHIVGDATSGGNLSNGGTIDGAAKVNGNHLLTNTATGNISGGANSGGALSNAGTIDGKTIASGDLTNSGMINAGEVSAQNILNSGTINLKQLNPTITAGKISASGDLTLDSGNGQGNINVTTTGLNKVDITAGGTLELQGDGVAYPNTHGVIDIEGNGTGTTTVTAGTKGNPGSGLKFTNGAWIADSSNGNLTIKVNNGGLTVGGGNLIKSGGGKLNVDVVGTLTNQATISGYAKAEGDLTNSGRIENGASVIGNHQLANEASGKISGSAISGGGLTNAGTIDGKVTVSANLANSGTIDTSEVSAQNILNSGTINLKQLNPTTTEGKISASGDLTLDGITGPGKIKVTTTGLNKVDITAGGTLGLQGNGVPSPDTQGVIDIGGNGTGTTTVTAGSKGNLSGGLKFTNGAWIADSSNGDLTIKVNNGGLTVDGSSLEKTGGGKLNVDVVGTLANQANISGYAKAEGDLTNSGKIASGATVIGNHQLTNDGSGFISGGATSGGALSNAGTIDGKTIASGDLTNSGTINAGEVSARDILNSGTINLKQLDQTITVGKINASRNLTLDGITGPGKIKVTTTGLNKVDITAGGILELQGNGVPSPDTQGVIDIEGNGTGTTTVTAGTKGNLSSGMKFTNGAWIADSSNGDLNIKVNNGGLTVDGSSLEKSGSGKLNVDVVGTLANQANISGYAKAEGDLTNSGKIASGATVIGNHQLTNDGSGLISGGASSGGGITNDGRIDGGASANGALLNRGSIQNGATVIGDHLLSNTSTGSISGDANSGGGLTNAGTVNGDAISEKDLINNGSITGNATASSGQLVNRSLITLDASADTGLVNTGIIKGNANVDHGDLSNTNSIEGDAEAGGSLSNTGVDSKIGGHALAKNGLLTNDGTITAYAESGQGALTNHGAIGTGKLTDYAVAGGNIVNDGTINARATAGAELINTGSISGGASAEGMLTNGGNIQNGATVYGDFELINEANGVISGGATSGAIHNSDIASGGKLTNLGTVNDGATTGGELANNGEINGGATANGTLANSGTIRNGATVVGNHLLNNAGTISGNANSGGDLTNDGTVNGDAISESDLTNNGTIAGNATASSGQLVNHSVIGLDATAGTSLDNTGIIKGNAKTNNGDLTNSNSIVGDAEAGGGLSNSGVGSKIGGHALANNGLLTNDGTIVAYAESSQGALTNHGTIGTDNVADFAAAGGDILNDGIINGFVKTDASLTNSGTISAGATTNGDNLNRVQTGADLTNSGQILIDGIGDGNVEVGNDLKVVGAGAEIGFDNTGTAKLRVHGDALVDEGGKLNFANDGRGEVEVTGNLILGQAGKGVIERSGINTEDFTVDPTASGSYLAINNAGSGIIDSRAFGNLIVSANQKISMTSGGLISRNSSRNTSAQLILYTPLIEMQGSKIFSSGRFNMAPGPNVTLAQIQTHQVAPLVLEFKGTGSVLKSIGNFGINKNVFYTLPENGLFGNTITSVNGRLFIAPDNLAAIQRNGRNIGGPYREGDPLNNNYNYFGNGFKSNQSGILQSINLGVISKPADLPVPPADPCGAGSTLEVEYTNGVVPAWGDLASFSVFPQEERSEGEQPAAELNQNPSERESCVSG